MEIGEEKLSLFQPGQVSLDRLLDLHDHLGLFVDGIGGGKNRRSGGDVFIVTEAAAVAGAGLDENFVAVGGEVLRARRRHPHAVFIVLDLGRYSDAHWLRSPSNVIAERGSPRRAHSSGE